VLITVVQEARTERVLEALKDMTSPRALVIRDGQRKRIAGREVVCGDLIVLAEGDRIPADVRLLEANDLQVDESLLTGEAIPVGKIADESLSHELPRPGGENLPFAFSGTLIVRGTAISEVTATGVHSEIGKIGKILGSLKIEAPHLQSQMRKLVSVFAIFGGAVSLLVVALYGLLRGGWLDAILAGIAIGMAMLPEEFPVVLAVFMAMGAWRISQVRVLTRRASAIETLGSATVLCTDKTGTLTENLMSIAELRLADGEVFRVPQDGSPLPEPCRELSNAGQMASAPEPFDPMEKAFHALAGSGADESDAAQSAETDLVRTYALRPELLAMSQVWRASSGYQVATKGAPEAVASLCCLDGGELAAMTKAVNEMATAGLRVLGVATANFAGSDLPDKQQSFDFQFVGLVGLVDPLRQGVEAAVADCHSSGIRVIMITGDYPETARAIALQAGIPGDDLITGEQLQSMDDEDLGQRVRSTTIFARIMPEQKLRIVEALKSNGEIVAMTGDGVNDAPSLKAAHIGVAMGGRGTDVAREAAAIVLLDDDFGSVVTTIRLGRRIYDNLGKSIGFILAVHVPIAGLALMPLLFGLPLIFGPVHIAFLEMVIDPVCSLVFEAETEEDDVMDRPPRPSHEPLISAPTIIWSLLQGVLALGLVVTVFVIMLQNDMSEDKLRAMTFVSLVSSFIALIFVNRSFGSSVLATIRRPNRALAFVLPIILATLGLAIFLPLARGLFDFGVLGFSELAIALSVGALLLVTLELAKFRMPTSKYL